MIRPLCVFCGRYPVRGWQKTAKYCSRTCCLAAKNQRALQVTPAEDISAAQIDALYQAARARQRRTKWRAA